MRPPLERVNQFLNWEQELFSNLDTQIYGTGYTKCTNRAWYNPLRWLMGKEKVKRLDPHKVLIDPNKDGAYIRET